MDAERLKILREALDIRQRKEDLERAIGRAVRKNNLDFKVYLEIVDELRESAARDKTSIEAAASRLLDQQKRGDDERNDQNDASH